MDVLFHHGNLYTMNPNAPRAQAALARDGRFVAVGGNEEILRLKTPGAQTVDLSGATAYPGLIDSHLHILNFARTARGLELNACKTRVELFEKIRARASSCPEGTLIEGRGFNEDLWDDRRVPERRELDEAAPNHPLILTRVCGHMAVGNSAAIALAGIKPDIKSPEGGEMDLDKGIFCENAISLLCKEKDAGVETCKQLLLEGMNAAADAGLTAIFSDDFGTAGFSFETVARAYRELEEEGKMPVRVVQQCAFPDSESFSGFLKAGFSYGQGSDFYRIGPRKLYADGSLGARTAWLSVPYADRPDISGVPIYAQEELNSLAEESHRAGMPFIVHAIGDAAAESVLDAVEYARARVPGTERLRDGIVHCQITTRNTLARIAKLGVCVYAQPVFVEYDLHICRARVGKALEESSYNWKTLLDAGVCVSSGSDCPVETLAPAKNIYCAVTRKDYDGFPEGGWLPDQRLTVLEAIAGHTLNAARAAGMEDRMGMIREGYLADLSVFSKDFSEIPAEEIQFQRPVMTVVGGRVREPGKA